MDTGQDTSTSTQSTQAPPVNQERKILLIDDEVHFCNLAAEILATSICRLSSFTDSHEGLREALTHKSYDLILLDIDMPSPNGLEILTQLKKSHLRHVPVMMFTAHAEMEMVQKALDLGAQDYLLKPFTVMDFVSRLNHLLHTDIFQGRLHPVIEDEKAETPSNSRFVSSDELVPRVVLMIDDEEQQLKLVQDMFEGSACQLRTTSSATEALQMLEESPPALILLDLHMPGMDGFAFLQTLRSQNSEVPVIVLTSDNTEESLAMASQFQLAGYLLKPYRFHELISKIEKVLQINLFPERL